jgi:hypothetical protein
MTLGAYAAIASRSVVTVDGMLGLELTTVRDVALAIVVGAVVLAVVAALIVKVIVSKVIVVGFLLVGAAVVWQQRGAVVDCADSVRQTLSEGTADDTTCTFFGRDVTVASPLG